MKPPFAWDPYSDQPYQLKDRDVKKRLRRQQRGSLFKTVLSALAVLPAALLAMPFLRQRDTVPSHFAGLVIDPLREPETTLAALQELGAKELLVRIKMWKPEQLDAIVAFLKQLEGYRLFFVLMQDREHVEDAALRRLSMQRIFTALTPFSERFQIGTTPNRSKWGFAGVDEYLAFFKTAQRLKAEQFPGLKLIGPGVIDFEYPYAAHALFNFSGVRFDAASALLYVDRRGAPENSQAGCDLPCKINLMASLVALSPRARFPLYITETNWPLSGTAPWAPTSEHECVDEETYASYMVRYYLLALASRQIRTVYWHQLVAPGYGLIDHREGIKRRPAFQAFKTMQQMLKNADFLVLKQKESQYEMLLKRPDGVLRVFWSSGKPVSLPFSEPASFVTRDGQRFTTGRLVVNAAPVYLLEKDAK